MNFVKSLAKMLGPKGIRVNGVAPGPVYTPLQISGGAMSGTSRISAPTILSAARSTVRDCVHLRAASRQRSSYTTGNIYGAGGGKGQP
jgi:NAD(P)-dependent dehydrogenase (short-subunit alcohol dehydrogenase family)